MRDFCNSVKLIIKDIIILIYLKINRITAAYHGNLVFLAKKILRK
jgi:hypothetical protein